MEAPPAEVASSKEDEITQESHARDLVNDILQKAIGKLATIIATLHN